MKRRNVLKGFLTGAVGSFSSSLLYAGDLDLKKLGIATVNSGAEPKVVTYNGNAFLLSENSEIELAVDPETLFLKSVRLLSGAVHGVFDPGQKSSRQLITPDAMIGVRGTGVYARHEPENERTYCCLCYGAVHVDCTKNEQFESMKADYHSPRLIDKNGVHSAMNVPMKHTDEDLLMLESKVGRVPHWVLPAKGKGMM